MPVPRGTFSTLHDFINDHARILRISQKETKKPYIMRTINGQVALVSDASCPFILSNYKETQRCNPLALFFAHPHHPILEEEVWQPPQLVMVMVQPGSLKKTQYGETQEKEKKPLMILRKAQWWMRISPP